MLLKGVLLALYAAPLLMSVKASMLPSLECQPDIVLAEVPKAVQRESGARLRYRVEGEKP